MSLLWRIADVFKVMLLINEVEMFLECLVEGNPIILVTHQCSVLCLNSGQDTRQNRDVKQKRLNFKVSVRG